MSIHVWVFLCRLDIVNMEYKWRLFFRGILYFAEVGSAIFFPGPQNAIPHIIFIVWKVFYFYAGKTHNQPF